MIAAAELEPWLVAQGVLVGSDDTFTFAGGDVANQKLDFDRIERDTFGYHAMIRLMEDKLAGLFPKADDIALVPIPSGAAQFTHDLAAENTRFSFYSMLEKDPDTRALTLKDRFTCADDQPDNIVFVDDIFTRGTMLRRAHALLPNALGSIVGWDRSPQAERRRCALFYETGHMVSALIHTEVALLQQDNPGAA